jgi:DNA end-binding protein Ku
MAPRASWKGFLNLSMVSVPVKAYTSSNSGSQVRLNQLHAACNSRIKQKTVCPLCGDVARDDIVKGYEYAKDTYVVVDLEELEKLRSKDEGRAIRIDCFVEPSAIDPIHFSDSHYFLVPEGAAGQKPFALLRQTMVTKGLHCVAKVVLHNKEQLVLVRPVENLLCMTVLKYATQVKSTEAFKDEVAEVAISDAEVELANTLIDETTAGEFDLDVYKDEYTEKLTQLIEAKVSGEEIVEAPSAETSNVINLMEALRASVQRAQADVTPSPASQARKPASRKKAAAKESGAAQKLLADQLSKPKKKKAAARRKKKSG